MQDSALGLGVPWVQGSVLRDQVHGETPLAAGGWWGGGGGVVQSPAVALVRTSLGCPEAQGASTVALTSAGRQRGGLSGPHSSLGPGGQESLHLPHEG